MEAWLSYIRCVENEAKYSGPVWGPRITHHLHHARVCGACVEVEVYFLWLFSQLGLSWAYAAVLRGITSFFPQIRASIKVRFSARFADVWERHLSGPRLPRALGGRSG